VLINFT